MPDNIVLLKQVSVFLENRPGALAEVTRTLATAGVNLRALMIAETERFGIMLRTATSRVRSQTASTESRWTARQPLRLMFSAGA